MKSSLTPQEFVLKWSLTSLKERSSSQEHFLDLCSLLSHSTPADLDPHGEFFCFEAGANKSQGGQGWADVWYRGHFAWEYKGKHADLDKAYRQLLQYREALENPPLLIVSDIDHIIIHTNFTNSVKVVYTLKLNDLLQPDKLAILRSVFYSPIDLRAVETTEQVTQEAAAQFSRLAEMLRKYGENPQQIAHFLIRLLFCLFAEDVGLLPSNVFSRLVETSRKRPQAFNSQLRQLFTAMSTGGWFGSEEILHFDGHLFDDAQVLYLDSDGLEILLKVSTLDWASIEPSIFGTLFERSLDPGKRAQLGAHYTSKEDILLIVEPVLMAPYRDQWRDLSAQARDLASKRDQATGSQRAKLQSQLASLLQNFAHSLSQVQILDPACGSGNFLYVSLRQLLDLEKQVITLAGELNVGRFFPSVNPSQLHGIEINEYAHQLAQATIQIGHIQWLRENGFGVPSEPILKPLDNILLMDAILAYDDSGKPVEPEWPKADIIIGNPPFLGGKRLRNEFGDDYVNNLFLLYKNQVPPEADLVCYWFEKARQAISAENVKRAGLLATQGIRGGANRKVLEQIKQTGDIFWAQSDRDWILDGANVHVSMIGFDKGIQTFRELDGYPVAAIHSNLTTVLNITQARRLPENSNLSFMGVTPAGPFDISGDQARQFLAAKGNPNGKPNSDVIHPYYNGVDLTTHTRDVWIIDFEDMSQEQAACYEQPFEYVKKVVKPFREKSRIPDQPWWLFTRPRPTMRLALQPLSRYIGTSMVAKHRMFSWIPSNIVPANLIIIIARSDDYFFGVLHSRLHGLWASYLGTALEDRPRYTPTTTFETFPFPWPPGQEPWDDPHLQAISAASKELVQLRDAWLNPPGLTPADLKKRTLTNLYNQRPTWLQLAHKKLDEAVFAAYGWPSNLTDEQILERLLELNLQRASHP